MKTPEGSCHPIFISHSGADSEVSQAFYDSLLACIPQATDKIFNTSILGSGVDMGESVTLQVRDQIIGCKYFFAILTPQSIRSAWVMFECGAAWANKKKPYLLIHPEVEIPGPFRDVNLTRLDTKNADVTIFTIFGRIAKDLKLGEAKIDRLETIRKVLDLALRPTPISDTAVELKKQTNIAVLDRTFKFIERWENDQLRPARDMERDVRGAGRQLTYEEVHTQPELERSVIYMFNYFEELYYALKHDAVDADVAVDALRDPFLSVLQTYEPWLLRATKSDRRYVDKQEALRRKLENYTLPPV